MTEREYHQRAKALRAQYESECVPWIPAIVFAAFDRYNAAQSALFSRWCRGGATHRLKPIE